jgi:hypothetical protein
MRTINILGAVITLIMIFIGCEKAKDPAGQRNIAVIPVISDVNPGIFNSTDLENAYVEFKASEPAGRRIDKITIVGSYGENSERILIKEITTFPATVRITSSDVAQKLGITLNTIKNDDVFTFELLTLANGITTRSNAFILVPVACGFNEALTVGSYHAVSPWPSDNNVTITADPDDPYTLYIKDLAVLDGVVEDLGPFVIHINPSTFEVSADDKLLASDYFGYGGVAFSGSGTYSSCTGSYVLNIDISVGSFGSQGVYQFDLTRNQ